MRKLILFIILVIPRTVSSQTWEVFTSDEIEYTVSYPVEWNAKMNDGAVPVFTSPSESVSDDFFENINIRYEKTQAYGENEKIADAGDATVDALKKAFNKFKLEKKDEQKLSGADGLELIYTGIHESLPDVKLRFIQRFYIVKSYLLIITYTAKAEKSNKWDTDAKRIMESVTFK